MNRCCCVLVIWLSLWSASVADQSVVILVDDSGSMNELMRNDRRQRRIDAAKQALVYVMEQLPDDASVGVYALNGGWTVPLGPVDRQQLGEAISRLGARGRTPLGAAMKVATDALLEARQQKVYGDYRLLIVSDGEATDARLVERYLPDIQQRGITIDVIGVSMDGRHSLATRVDRYRRADDHDSLVQAMEESLAEMSTDDQDTDEAADFSLLQGLPDDVAVAVIDALSQPDNEPIGDPSARAEPTAPQPPQTAAPSPPRAPAPTAPRPQPNDPPTESPSKVGMFVILFILMIVIRTVIRTATRQRG